MIDVTSNEFKQQVRSHFFNNSLVKSGIVQVVDEPFDSTLRCTRYQSWRFDRFGDQVSSEAIANRIGEYVSVCMSRFFLSVFQGVAGPEQLPEDETERNNYRAGLVALFQDASRQNEHPIALVPSSLVTRLQNQLLLSYHLCPFTKKRIPSYEDKRLVWDDMCLQPILSYPGEIKVFFHTPDEETKIDPDDSNVFSYWWDYSVSIKGFEYTEPANPSNNYVANSDCWKPTAEKSRLVRIR